VHLLSFALQPQLKMGRGQEADIKVPDISVSRCHAQIEFDQGKFYLKDLDSKFGTIVLLKESPIVNNLNKQLQIQIGMHLFVFRLKSEWKTK